MTLEASVLPAVIDAVDAAAAMLAEESRRPAGPRGAGSKAEIDVEIEQYLADALTVVLPARFVGEETPARPRDGSPYCWLVDPHDGVPAGSSRLGCLGRTAARWRTGAGRRLRAHEP